MKSNLLLAALTLFALAAIPARAVLIETHSFTGLNLDIPDGNPSGLANVQNFTTFIGSITDLEVSLKITATPDFAPLAFAGDLYIYLSHSTGFSVLLNRVGRALAAPFGYDDNGLDITLDDEAGNGDVHLYRTVTTPSPGSPLTGTWSPDARATDPNLVLDTDPRTSLLSNFDGLSAAGDWTLFVADLSTGEEHRLEDWSLKITGEAVPEPATAALLALGALGVLTPRRRRRLSGCAPRDLAERGSSPARLLR